MPKSYKTEKRQNLAKSYQECTSLKVYLCENNKDVKFAINIETNCLSFNFPTSKVYRSFAEFQWLRRTLLKHCDVSLILPNLPSKFLYFWKNRDKALEARRDALECFLVRLIQMTEVMSSSHFQFFLQTNLCIKGIEEAIEEDRQVEMYPPPDDNYHCRFHINIPEDNIINDFHINGIQHVTWDIEKSTLKNMSLECPSWSHVLDISTKPKNVGNALVPTNNKHPASSSPSTEFSTSPCSVSSGSIVKSFSSGEIFAFDDNISIDSGLEDVFVVI